MLKVNGIILDKIIGKGNYGVVYSCSIPKKTDEKLDKKMKERMRPGRKVACKRINAKKVFEFMKYFKQELKALVSFRHQNILRFLRIMKSGRAYNIFVEFCNGGTLSRLLNLKGGTLSEKEVSYITAQISSGLKYLNSQNAMHRDLKLDNILLHFPHKPHSKLVDMEEIKNCNLVEEEVEVVIGDLGFARQIGNQEMAESYCGTPLNMAPEIMNHLEYNSKVDIWSLGTVVYELLVGFAPFSGKSRRNLRDNVNLGEYGVPKNIKLSLNCLDFLDKCLRIDPSKRIRHEDLENHPFLTEDDSAEKIELYASMGPSQRSFFEPPSNAQEIDSKNAVIINAADSILFNNLYAKTMEKHASKMKEEGKEKEIEHQNNQDITKLESILETQDNSYFTIESDESGTKGTEHMVEEKLVEIRANPDMEFVPDFNQNKRGERPEGRLMRRCKRLNFNGIWNYAKYLFSPVR